MVDFGVRDKKIYRCGSSAEEVGPSFCDHIVLTTAEIGAAVDAVEHHAA